jgi:hypothetical protein
MKRFIVYSQRDKVQWVAQLPKIFWNSLLPLFLGILFGVTMDWFYLVLGFVPALVSFEYLNKVEIEM